MGGPVSRLPASAIITRILLTHFCHHRSRNDIFINGFGLFTSAAGVKIAWWLDPAGATFISVILIWLWGQTCTTNFQLLAGIAAPEEFRQLVIYKAMTYSSEIVAIDSVAAYHAGPDLVVEVDIVMKVRLLLSASLYLLWCAY